MDYPFDTYMDGVELNYCRHLIQVQRQYNSPGFVPAVKVTFRDVNNVCSS